MINTFLAEFSVTLPSFVLFSKAKLASYSRYLLTSYFCILVPYDEKDILFIFLFFWC